MKETFTLFEEGLENLAEKVLKILADNTLTETVEGLPRARVILLEGDLGAGKTTFTKTLAQTLGVNPEDVHSPTFILKKTYGTTHPTFTKLVHVDAYRFTHPSEASVLQLEEDLKDKNKLVVIEWPNKMDYLKADLEIIFKVIDDNTREVTLAYD